jgi:hypothetical protein
LSFGGEHVDLCRENCRSLRSAFANDAKAPVEMTMSRKNAAKDRL